MTTIAELLDTSAGQVELAYKIGISQFTIAKWKERKNGIPNQHWAKIRKAFPHITLKDLASYNEKICNKQK